MKIEPGEATRVVSRAREKQRLRSTRLRPKTETRKLTAPRRRRKADLIELDLGSSSEGTRSPDATVGLPRSHVHRRLSSTCGVREVGQVVDRLESLIPRSVHRRWHLLGRAVVHPDVVRRLLRSRLPGPKFRPCGSPSHRSRPREAVASSRRQRRTPGRIRRDWRGRNSFAVHRATRERRPPRPARQAARGSPSVFETQRVEAPRSQTLPMRPSCWRSHRSVVMYCSSWSWSWSWSWSSIPNRWRWSLRPRRCRSSVVQSRSGRDFRPTNHPRYRTSTLRLSKAAVRAVG